MKETLEKALEAKPIVQNTASVLNTTTNELPTGLPSNIAQQDFDEQIKAVNELWQKVATSQAKAFEQLNPNLTPQPHNAPKCTCGTHKTYGLAAEPRMHSDWCFFYEAVKSN